MWLIKKNQTIVDANPPRRTSTKQMRKKDRARKDGQVRNPLYTCHSLCLVCKFVHNKKRLTANYCRECTPEPHWPQTNRSSGYQKEQHPRLCSDACFQYFHINRIPGLDFEIAIGTRRRRKNPKCNTPQPKCNTPTPEYPTVNTTDRAEGVISRAINHINTYNTQSRTNTPDI